MYKVRKAKGYGTNIIIENTDTKANVILGTIPREVMTILKDAGYEVEDIHQEWDVEVNKETATLLSQLAMKMKKPIRDQRKTETKKEANKHIDAMDVMLGLASYS